MQLSVARWWVVQHVGGVQGGSRCWNKITGYRHDRAARGWFAITRDAQKQNQCPSCGQGGSDGEFPNGGLALDDRGDLFGTTVNGGTTANGGLGFGILFSLDKSGTEARRLNVVLGKLLTRIEYRIKSG
jgi:hypothetical protein